MKTVLSGLIFSHKTFVNNTKIIIAVPKNILKIFVNPSLSQLQMLRNFLREIYSNKKPKNNALDATIVRLDSEEVSPTDETTSAIPSLAMVGYFYYFRIQKQQITTTFQI